MTKKDLFQILAALALAVLLTLLTEPFMRVMPLSLAVGCLALSGVFAGVFAWIAIEEQGGDERERANRAFSGRVGYLVALLVTAVGVLYQGVFDHAVDPWLAAALGALVIGKLGARLFAERYR